MTESFCAHIEALDDALESQCVAIAEPPLMNTIDMKPDVLDEMIRQQKKHLQDLLKLQGDKTDQVEELCQFVGIKKQTLAKAMKI